MKKLSLLLLFLILAPSFASAQNAILQGGPTAPGHGPMYVSGGGAQAVAQDSGPAGGGGIGLGYSEMLLAARGSGSPPYANAGTGPSGTNWCDYDAPTTNPTGYHYLCLSPNAQGGGLITYGAGGIAAPLPFSFIINGVTLFPATLPNATTSQLYGGSGTPGLAAVVSLGSGLNLTGGVLTATATASLPVATTIQLYGGTGTAGLASVVTLGSGLNLAGGILTATGAGGAPGGPTTAIQANGSGTFTGSAALTTNGTGQLNIGNPGAVLGIASFGNLTSGAIALQAASGPLGSSVLSLPAVTDTLAVLGNINTALPNATTSQLYGGSGGAGIATLVNIGSGLSLTTGTLSATGGGGGTGTAQRATFCATSVWITGTCQPTAFTPGTTAAITLPFTPTSSSAVWVWTDAGYADAYTYVISGTTLTFNSPINAQTQVIEVTAGVASGGFAPGGSAGDVQFNASAFGGNPGFVYDGTSIVSLGVSGSSTGAVQLANTTSGTLTVRPPTTGALGSNVLTLPIGTTTLAGLGLVQSWSAAQTFANNDLLIKGSSTGTTVFSSANASATNYTLTVPANSGTLAELNLAQSWSAIQSFVNSGITLGGSSSGVTTFASASSSASNFTITFPAATGTVLTTAAAVSVPQGGTGDVAFTAYAPVFGGTTSTGNLQSGTPGTAGQILTSNGAGALPTFQANGGGGNSAIFVNASTTCGMTDKTGATDYTTAFANCVNTNGAVAVPEGTYLVCGAVITATNVSIVGAGITPSSNISGGRSTGGTIFTCNNGTSNILTMGQSSYTSIFMQGFSCTRSVAASAGACVGFTGGVICATCTFRDLWAENQYNGFALPPAISGWIDNVWAWNNYNDGFLFNSGPSSNISYSSVGVVAEFNNAYGFEFVNANASFNTVGTWHETIAFANGTGGIYAHVTGGGTLNDLYFTGITLSDNNGDGIQWNTGGGSNLQVSGGLIEGAGQGISGGGVGRNQAIAASQTGNAIDFAGTNISGLVSGVTFGPSSANAIGTTANLTSIVITGNFFYDSGVVAGICGGNCNHITIGGPTTLSPITGNTFFTAGAHQAFAIFSNSANTSATGNVMSNSTGNGCSITVAGSVKSANIAPIGGC